MVSSKVKVLTVFTLAMINVAAVLNLASYLFLQDTVFLQYSLSDSRQSHSSFPHPLLRQNLQRDGRNGAVSSSG